MQGVGFRPFVYKLAKRYNLKGEVSNNSFGVEIILNSDKDSLDSFLKTLKNEAPPLSKIDSIEVTQIDSINFSDFKIVKTKNSDIKTALIPPDVSVCSDCIDEMFDKSNRRYLYPFITCTNCGPRYSIIKTVPYDRVNTSMAKFDMCSKCQAEYSNPNDRRYHAQPIGCWECGAKLKLYIKQDNKLILKKISKPIDEVANAIKNGKIVAIKGIGGFHLICDATLDSAVGRLRNLKKRATKPFAVMVPNIEYAKDIANINQKEQELLQSPIKPIVLLQIKKSQILSSLIAPNIDRVGLMLPYTPIHYLLMKQLNRAIIATSANISGEPIITDIDTLKDKLSFMVEMVLDNDRDIINGCDDSIAQIIGSYTQWIRVARGLTPAIFHLDRSPQKVLAVGANQKNSIAIKFDDIAVISPYIGDLDTIDSLEYFKKSINTLKRFYDFNPDIIVSDKHPEYLSTKWAKSQDINIIQIQHHYAHALSVMAEHKFKSKALAIIWDGTGYGDDGTIWGGEVMIVDNKSYKRVANLKEFKLIGSQKAIKEPRRVAISMLFELYSLDEILQMDNPTIKAFSSSEIKLLYQSWQRGLNAPISSSMGRVFDAIASLSGLIQSLNYEGESGLLIETQASKKIYNNDIRLFKIENNIIDWTPLIKEALSDREFIASKLLISLKNLIIDFASIYPNLPIILSGGVFQNRLLMQSILNSKIKDRLMLPIKMPPNDGGIALGQVYGV